MVFMLQAWKHLVIKLAAPFPPQINKSYENILRALSSEKK